MKNKISKLDHINFTVENLDQSIDWYHRVFNFQVVERGVSQKGVSWCILKSGESMLALSEFKDRKIFEGNQYHQTYHFGLRLEDKEEWESHLKELEEPTYHSSAVHYPFSTSWYVKDPTGNEIEVAIWKDDQVQFE